MTVNQALRECRGELEEAGIADSGFEARCLVQKILNCSQAGLISCGSDKIAEDRHKELWEYIKRRKQHEPLQYILGSWNFCGFDFCVGEGVLIPRDDTEVVVNLCVEFLKNRKGRKTADLCAGTGAVSVALEKLADAQVTAVELSDSAFGYLEKNIGLNNCSLQALKGDVFSCYTQFEDKSFDLIVSNPPYICSDEIPFLQKEVQKEPKTALDGGRDGCDFYRAITKFWSKKLRDDGAMAFEIGENQADFVEQLLKEQGFKSIIAKQDLSGTKRAVIGRL